MHLHMSNFPTKNIRGLSFLGVPSFGVPPLQVASLTKGWDPKKVFRRETGRTRRDHLPPAIHAELRGLRRVHERAQAGHAAALPGPRWSQGSEKGAAAKGPGTIAQCEGVAPGTYGCACSGTSTLSFEMHAAC